jgi:tRNA (guanine37-N1)-methyltransferase
MKFHVITLYPELILNYFKFGVVGTAADKKIIEVNTVNPRDFTEDVHKSVDDRPYGGGDGMVLMAPILEKSLQSIKTPENSRRKVIYLSAQGVLLSEKKVLELSQLDDVILINGRYGGIDQRFINSCVDEEVSIGDYVLSGGELASLVLMDAVTRKIPGVLGHGSSANEDSFSQLNEGGLEAPLYTRPADWNGRTVPEILKEGHHQKISDWRKMMSWLVTLQKRPDLLPAISEKEKAKILNFYLGLSLEQKKNLGLREDLQIEIAKRD